MKKDPARVGTPWRLLSMGFIVFIIAAVVYLGMDFGYKPFISSQIGKTQAKIDELVGSITEEEAQNSVTFYSQMSNINELLNSKKIISQTFGTVKDNTLKNIYYSSFGLDYGSQEIRMEGAAPTYEALAQQIDIFRKLKEVKGVKLENARKDQEKTGRIIFSLKLQLK